ncbi:transporter substrate-binding domain-containing protein [Simiduia curdlanivorans]|uniref:Substrate-binding periplasmic protein n=1 Tax=Simiduia curdlanivorans TaxID=1492769 RepID=A0ABV8UZM0_9GAMM|nr:transporter substrate-binding domain-containing protein [Simiduia curdlanivorans]MDN3640509.1 transporter substrate-binding domain-containing protein [Simiduia curdlanivorans]
MVQQNNQSGGMNIQSQSLVGFFLGLVFLVGAGNLSAKCIKTVRWSDDPPYSWRSDDGELHGIYIDFSRALMQRLNCEPQFVQLPWARALAELEAGRLDLLFGAFIDTNRERFAYFSLPINRSPNVLFITTTAAEKYDLKQLADIMGTNFRLGAQIGVNYNGDFEKLHQNPALNERLLKMTNRQGGWKMMAVNRLDGLIADEVTALRELQELGLMHVIHKGTIEISGQAAAMAFSKKSVSADFVQQFNANLEAMKLEGSYKAVLARYLPCDIDIEQLGCR